MMASERKTLSTKVRPEIAQEVEELAEQRDEDKSKILRDVIQRGIEDRHWTRHLAPIFKEATNVSAAFAALVPLLMLFFTDHSWEDAFLLAMVFTAVSVAAALLAINFAEDADEVFG